ncbi:MAG: lycopene cyclase domain-containing protein, partial [Candidatus Aramenus sp.]|nr:lycopene cyclase domain-containing protein [Candidatus Aramenus sp.]
MEFNFFQPHLAYLEIDSLIFFPTLFISIISKVKRRYKSLLLSMAIVSPLYLAWDFWATWVGSWRFNPKWVLGIYVFDLPLEEVLFFFVTPFATLLIYDFITQKFKDKEVHFITKRRVVMVSAFLLVMSALLSSYSYTSIDLLYLAISFLVVEYFDESMFRSRNYWAFLLLTYVPFFVFD